MNGIPVKVWRDQAQETVYLSCARMGEQGGKIAQLKRQVRACLRLQANAARKLALLQVKAEQAQKIDAPAETFEAILEEQAALLEALNAEGERHLDFCQQLWLAALEPNHGPDAEKIVNCLSDRQVVSVLKVLELGECPADFFPSSEPSASGNGTGPSAGLSTASSWKKDSPPPM